MGKNYVKLMAAGMLIPVLMTGCGPNGNVINKGANGAVSEDADDSVYNAGEQESLNDTKPEQSEENKDSQSQPQATAAAEENSQPQPQATVAAEDIEKELAAYRADREKMESSKGNYTFAGVPNEENYKYGIGSSSNSSYTDRFDDRELTKALEAANTYIVGTLNLESEAYICEDPRMIAIYEDEDKGVADGYDADNIFICEYNDNGKWQYLILVREKKGSDWKVLYHGSSYKTD